jgi:hypothetical protein
LLSIWLLLVVAVEAAVMAQEAVVLEDFLRDTQVLPLVLLIR